MVGCHILPFLDPSFVSLALHWWLEREGMVETEATTLEQ